MTISQRVQEICKEKNIMQKTLAAQIGVSTSTMSLWLSKGTDFPAKFIIPICDALEVSPYYLLTGEDEPNTKIQLLSEDEMYLLQLYRPLEIGGKAMVTAKALEENRRINPEGSKKA